MDFTLKILRENPPNYEEITKVLTPNEQTVFTYGDTIYAPHVPEDVELPPDLIQHELVHVMQQGKDPAGWWKKYLEDATFRLSEELTAYGAQYRFVDGLRIKRESKDNFLDMIAGHLSSEVYGNLLSQGAARSKIRNMAKEN